MYFMIKDESIFYKYMTVWEKVSNIIKNIISELIHNKKYLKAERRKLSVFYIPAILFDSVYGKVGNYHPKVFLERFIHKFFWRITINFGFWDFASFA